MNKLRFAVVSALTFSSFSTLAANYAVDARGDAMGGTGVVSATYLTAPFYNPALTAIYRRNDDAGMLLPSFGLMYDDSDKMVDNLDVISDNIDSITSAIDSGDFSSISLDTVEDVDQALTNLDGSQAKLEVGGAAAFGIPNPYLSMTVFGKIYTESFVSPDVYSDSTQSTEAERVAENAELTAVNAVSIGVAEAGLSIARYSTVFGQHMSFGISPKLQRFYTYVYTASADNYEIEDIRDNGTGETIFNLDFGALWFYGPIRVGFTGMNMIGRDIDTKVVETTLTSTAGTSRTISTDYSYKMRPQYTVGIGYVDDYFALSVDYDLNEDERFIGFDDNTQWFRAGIEIDLLRQLAFRGGYKKNLAYSDAEDTVTAGVGFSPLGLFELDVAVSYTSEDAMGGYVNFLATY